MGPESQWLPGYTIPHAVAREKINAAKELGLKLVMCTVVNSVFEDEKGNSLPLADYNDALEWCGENDYVEVVQNGLAGILLKSKAGHYPALQH